nr:MAG TPA: Arc-like DNA binding domain protein [Caudoviricetes sp.]
MPSTMPRYTLRIPKILLDKIGYIAEENGRSANREIELLIKQRIKEYEQENGVISPTDLEQ